MNRGIDEAGDDTDTEGNVIKFRGVDEADTEGHAIRGKGGVKEADTDGNLMRGRGVDESGDDTEGHKKNFR